MTTIDTAQELISRINLTSVRFIEFAGTVRSELLDMEPMTNLPLTLGYEQPDDGATIFVIMGINVDHPAYTMSIKVALEYALEPPAKVADDVRAEFSARSATFTAGPFLREALLHLGSRLQVPTPILPLMGPGGVQLQPVPDDGVQEPAPEPAMPPAKKDRPPRKSTTRKTAPPK